MCGEVECFALHRGNRVRRGQFLLPKRNYSHTVTGTTWVPLSKEPPPPP